MSTVTTTGPGNSNPITPFSEKDLRGLSVGDRRETPVHPNPGRTNPGHYRLTQARVARSEWIKLRSVRSTWWALGAFAATTIGTGVLICALAAAHAASGKHVGISGATLSLYGTYLAPLTIGVLGALAVTGEYMTGMIRSTLTAVPNRMPVLRAKLGVFAALALIVSEVCVFVTFLVGQAILAHSGVGASLGDPGVFGAVFGTGLYITITGLLGMALGSVIRNTAAVISTMFGVMVVLPVLVGLLPPTWTSHFAPYLPSNAGQAIMNVQPVAGFLAPWTGLAMFAGYTVAVVAAAAILLKRRDA